MYVNAFAADKLVPAVKKMTKGEAYTADDKEVVFFFKKFDLF